MRQAPQAFLSLGLAAFLGSCGQSAPLALSPISASAKQRAIAAPTEPYSVALVCTRGWAGEYKPYQRKPDRTFDYHRPSTFHDSVDDLETAAYDPKGNLYIAAENFLFSWVDGYAPGKTVRFLRINKDIHHPISMTTDPDGDLYVGNHGVLGHNVVMFMPSRGSADLTITDVSYPSDLVFAQGRLYVADSDKNQVRVYRILPRERKAILSWIISSGLHGPSQLSYNMHGRLWVLNKPFAGADEVREYRIAMDNEPVYIRSIKERRHYINAVATNPSNEDVYVAEVPLFGNPKSVISTYDRYGTFRYEVAIADLPHSIVSSPTRYYSASRFQAAMYADKSLESVLDLPGNCQHPYKLAMMQPSP